jgi:hypothetical protein
MARRGGSRDQGPHTDISTITCREARSHPNNCNLPQLIRHLALSDSTVGSAPAERRSWVLCESWKGVEPGVSRIQSAAGRLSLDWLSILEWDVRLVGKQVALEGLK